MSLLRNISISISGGVGWLRFDRPPVNAFNWTMLQEVDKAFDAMSAEPGVRVVVIGTTSDTHFSAGADLQVFREASTQQMQSWLRECHKIAQKIRGFEKPVLAAIRGIAVGGGLEMSLHADLRFAAATARLGQPEINIAFIPPVAGTQALVRLVGRSAAFRMLYTGELLSAEEARSIGLVDELHPADELEQVVQTFAERVANRPANALTSVRRCLTAGADVSLQDGLGIEAREAHELIKHHNFSEGVSAFLEKRDPRWH